MRVCNRWTEEEISILKEAIAENMTNRQEAFRVVAKKTGRTTEAVCQKWYGGVKKSCDPLFTVISIKNKAVNNSTSSTFHGKTERNIPTKIPTFEIFKSIIKLFKQG